MGARWMEHDWNAIKDALAERVRVIRRELYGEHGGPLLAEKLGISYRSWQSYEGGSMIPAEVILRLIEATMVNPNWLLRGEGPRYLRDLDENGLTS